MLYRSSVNLASPKACDLLGMHWGERLKQEREQQGKTGVEVAKAAGMTKSAVSQWERGGNVRPPHLFSVADFLGVSPRWLATGKGSREPKADLNDAEGRLLRSFRRPPAVYQGMLLADADKYLSAHRLGDEDSPVNGPKH